MCLLRFLIWSLLPFLFWAAGVCYLAQDISITVLLLLHELTDSDVLSEREEASVIVDAIVEKQVKASSVCPSVPSTRASVVLADLRLWVCNTIFLPVTCAAVFDGSPPDRFAGAAGGEVWGTGGGRWGEQKGTCLGRRATTFRLF